MLRSKALTEKLLLLGIDGMDPRYTKRLLNEGKLPNVKKLIELGSCRDDLMLLGANPTITPPMWATLATGCYPMTHGIMDYNLSAENDKDITIAAFSSRFLKVEPLFNVTAQAGKKTLVFHWPGGSFPPTIESENLYTIDGSSPGACGAWASGCDEDLIVIVSEKVEKLAYTPLSTRISELKGDEKLKTEPHVYPMKFGVTPEAKERVKKYKKEYKEFLDAGDYTLHSTAVGDQLLFQDYGSLNWGLADSVLSTVFSPIAEAKDWNINIPTDAKEFEMLFFSGKEKRTALLLKNDADVYDKVCIYKDKQSDEPIAILENDVFTGVYDTFTNKNNEKINVFRNMRVLEVSEDGTYIRIWVSGAMKCDDDSVWYPKSLHKEIVSRFGSPQPSSSVTGNDADLILKCNNEQWKLSGEWQSKAIHYLIEEHGVEVVFSHFHNVDMQSHNYLKYMKNRDTSRYDEKDVEKYAEETYKVTDEYLGSFMHLLDEGWTILLFSDHALICAEEKPYVICENSSVNVDPLRQWGYTVLKKDENGNEIPEIDWTKTRAIQARSNSIYLNIKGRDPHGIVDPKDKYELEEQIITELYGWKDEKTGKRIISLALHNKDAVLLGLGGPMGSDIVIFVHETFVEDHGPALSTSYGYNDTSLSPIFIAAGKGIKENFKTTRYIREVDVAPTAAVLLGVEMPNGCEGAPAYQILSESL
ncbi:MAG: alkaline phosphatase family protein [Peptococcaceae bacterium]|nr:alkaline phosphatase family protein [Peptococcaceae bacterium]